MPELRKRNHLAREKSPYLLQHAENPVDWYPWGEEAFEKARREDKPIFLSIGYSTCHWCHVMEKESFEDAEVAALLNASFVSIKVDREERPDIDNIYMSACQMMTGSGGWPLTIIMTAEKQPFFAGTYIPKENRYGRLGMLEFLPRVSDFWKNRRAEALSSAGQITETLRQVRTSQSGVAPDASIISAAVRSLHERFDSIHGGFGGAPKFPTPHNLTLLLRHWKRTGDAQSLAIVEKTLQEMRRGGIYDQIGFGFHRYSTDAEWLVPHFEKMLYDQALLVMAYVEAFQATGHAEYARTASEIITYVMRDMTSADGAFWSAEDADSEGEEGKFYLWSTEEVRTVLDPIDAELYMRVFNMEDRGNFLEQSTRERTGTNIPHVTESIEWIAGKNAKMASSGKERPPRNDGAAGADAEGEQTTRLEQVRQKLFEVRERRVHPRKDDKVLTDWNGLMIAAMAKAAQALDRPDVAAAAARAADFVLAKLRRHDGRLLHRYREGEAGLEAHLDDYAFMVWGLLEIYEAAFETRYLDAAIVLNREMLAHFRDDADGGLFFTADDAEELIARTKEIHDGAIPSGNAAAMLNLARLGRITGDSELEREAEAIAMAFAQDIRNIPAGHSQLLQALDFLLGPSNEIVICGALEDEDTRDLLRAIRSSFLPNKIVLLKSGNEPAITHIAQFTRPLTAISGKATAYVCRDFACQRPTTEPEEMLESLKE